MLRELNFSMFFEFGLFKNKKKKKNGEKNLVSFISLKIILENGKGKFQGN